MAEGFDQRQAVLLMYAWTALLCVGSLVMTQVDTFARIIIFVVVLAASFVFAHHLRLFEPVLLHHYDPETGEDELVTPADEAFEQEAERLHEHEGAPRERRGR